MGEGRRGGWVCGYLQLEGIVGANKIKNKNTLISQRLIIFLQKRKPLAPHPAGPPITKYRLILIPMTLASSMCVEPETKNIINLKEKNNYAISQKGNTREVRHTPTQNHPQSEAASIGRDIIAKLPNNVNPQHPSLTREKKKCPPTRYFDTGFKIQFRLPNPLKPAGN